MLQTAPIFQNGMVLQREKPFLIWGYGTPGKTLRISVQNKTAETVIPASGRWELTLPALKASKDEQIILHTEQEFITLEHVAVGEVWLAGGQSNMEFHMRYEKHKKEELLSCPRPNLRFYDVPEICYDRQNQDFDYSRMGIWRDATAENLEYFSAVGYYFQKEIADTLEVPIGIIGCNWGGTPSCSWMNPSSVSRAGKPWMQEYEDFASHTDMDEYWREQRDNPMNGRGDPFADEFGEFVSPRTPDAEEIAAFFAARGIEPFGMPQQMQPQSIPGSLYEHMLKTVAPYSIRGFLWYQGESDDVPGRQTLYKDMMTALIADWRALWNDNALPFLLVQLPGFQTWLGIEPRDYTTIRTCQKAVADTVPDAYLCSISDAGEQMDIHPKDKKTVGHRLALLARGHVYGEQILCDAPVAADVVRKNNLLTITFDNAKGGLKLDGDTCNALQVIQINEEIPFTAGVKGEQLVLQLPETIEGPLKVSFAQNDWYLVNLYNQADIPAIPFQVYC